MIDNPRSFIMAATHLMQDCGAKMVYLVATHGIFSGTALAEIDQCPHIHSVHTIFYHIILIFKGDCDKFMSATGLETTTIDEIASYRYQCSYSRGDSTNT